MPTFRALVLVSACCLGSLSTAEEATSVVDLFESAAAKQIGVTFIPIDEARANVLIENFTNNAIVIQLPDAIAAIPVLAQFGQAVGQGLGAGDGQNQGQNGGGRDNQVVGGNLNAGQGQGMGQGMVFRRIPPRKQIKLVASTVCLEHGKAEPNPRVAYRMIRLEEYTDDQQLAKLCREVGTSKLSQNTAQAIAWNLANTMSWDELAEVNSIESRYFGNVPYFQAQDIDLAKKWLESLNYASR